MDCIEYGNRNGQLVVYFHGVPGSPVESSIFDSHAKEHNLKIICFDRFAIDSASDSAAYYQQLASQIRLKAAHQPIDIVGFSIGAHVALEVGRILQGQVGQTHLISPAAPVNGGDFLDSMAGGLVFKLAMNRPFIFSILSLVQKSLALLAPRLLVKMMFSSAAGRDKELINQSQFKDSITSILKYCFQNRIRGYMRDIKLYVAWLGDFADYTSSVTVWQGTEDNWSPPAMASYLYEAIPGTRALELMEELSHYSCLCEAAPEICRRLEKL